MRAPCPPRLSIYLPLGTLLLLALGMVSAPVHLRASPVDRALFVAFAMVPLWLSAATFPLLKRLRVVEPYASDGKPWRWVVATGTVFGAMLVGYALRGWLQCRYLGWFGEPWEAVVAFLGPPPVAIWLVMWAEREAAFKLAVEREEAALGGAVAQLFSAREALLLARSRRVHEVVASLGGRASARVAAVEDALARLEAGARSGQAAPREALVALTGEIAAVAEDEFRQLSHVLHPSVVQAGLEQALRTLVTRFDALEGASFVVEPDARPATAGLAEKTVLSAYRSVEAALDNVRRHAHATRLEVTMAARDGWLSLSVADDGVGFEPAAVRWGMGFSAIDSRVTLAGGSWQVQSAPGQGTRLELRLGGPQVVQGGLHAGMQRRVAGVDAQLAVDQR